MNQTVLMSGAEFFRAVGNNSHSSLEVQPHPDKAKADFANISACVNQTGIKIVKVDPPADCPDGVYTANWALCRGNKAVLANLPNTRTAEMPYAEKILRGLGKEIIKVPDGLKFSGQGDALPCGNYLFAGTGYRTDLEVHTFLARELGYEVISLQAVPDLDAAGKPVNNQVTGWPDSFFYDIDLAISVLRPDLIAWCPDAFTARSQKKIRDLPMHKVEVSLKDAKQNFACNLLSNGQTVVMSSTAPGLKAAIESYGLKTLTPQVTELGKGGGYIRCTTLTLDNE